jgi:hypothetical protein
VHFFVLTKQGVGASAIELKMRWEVLILAGGSLTATVPMIKHAVARASNGNAFMAQHSLLGIQIADAKPAERKMPLLSGLSPGS